MCVLWFSQCFFLLFFCFVCVCVHELFWSGKKNNSKNSQFRDISKNFRYILLDDWKGGFREKKTVSINEWNKNQRKPKQNEWNIRIANFERFWPNFDTRTRIINVYFPICHMGPNRIASNRMKKKARITQTPVSINIWSMNFSWIAYKYKYTHIHTHPHTKTSQSLMLSRCLSQLIEFCHALSHGDGQWTWTCLLMWIITTQKLFYFCVTRIKDIRSFISKI